VRALLIHEFSPFTVQALLYAKRKHLPVVVSSEVGRGNASFFGRRTRWWHAFWGKFTDGVVACCPAAHEPLSGRKVPTVAAYHAVDSRLYLPAERGAPPGQDEVVTFAYLGQMIHRKGLDLWLRAAARLKSGGTSNFRLLFIGGGDRTWVETIVSQLGLGPEVEFTGFLSGAAIRETLGAADVFVLPTRQDTYAAVVHEAACLGLPLLISRHAGAAQALVEPGENGLVVDPEDTGEFAIALKQLMDPGVRAPMRAASRRIGESHSAHLRGAALWAWMKENQFVS
jgi:glycosyltransferase involved in cell wall biosynthesis